jgi:hypothetical protein
VTDYSKLVCPKCQRQLRVRTEYAGKVIACKFCGQAFVVTPRPAPTAAPAQAAGSRTASLDDKILRLRHELAAEDARGTQSPHTNVARLAEPLSPTQPEGAELNELAGLWRDLEAARTEREQVVAELETLRREVGETAGENERRLTDLAAELDSVRAARDLALRELETLRGHVAEVEAQYRGASESAAHHERRLTDVTGELESIRAARDEALRKAKTLRDQVAELERAHAETTQSHESAMQQAQSRWEAERQTLQAEAESRHGDAAAAHERQLRQEQARAAEALRQWQVRHAEAERRLVEEQAALRTEVERVHREWQSRHEAAVREHEERLGEEREHAAEQLSEHEERQGLLEGERDALRVERNQHAAEREQAAAEVIRLTEGIARHVEASTAASQREKQLADQLQELQSEQQQTLAALRAEASGLRERVQALEAQLASERTARQNETNQLRREQQALQKERDQAERRRRESEEQFKKESDRLKEAASEAQRRQGEHKQTAADKKALTKQVDAARRQLAEKDRQLAAQAKEQTRAAAEQQALREELAAAQRQHEQECAQLRRDADALRAEREAARAAPTPAPEAIQPIVGPSVRERQRPMVEPRRREMPASPAMPAPEPPPLRRQRFSVWACLPLGLLLWLASQPAGLAELTADAATSILFAVTLLLQLRLWDELEERGTNRPARPWRGAGTGAPGGWVHLVLFIAVGGNAAYLAFAFGIFSLPLAVFLVLNLVLLAWYGGLRSLFPGPVAASQVALLKYPAMVYLLGALTHPIPEPPLLLTMALVYLAFSVFELLHDDQLRATSGSAWLLALSMALLLGVSGLIAATLSERSRDAALIQAGATALGAMIFLLLFWRRQRGSAAGVWAYVVFVIAFAWLLNFSLGSQAYALPALPL